MKAWNSTLNISHKRLKRSPLKKPKPYRRTKPQKTYHDEHETCEIEDCRTHALYTPHHIDKRKLREDSEENMFSLCWNHHMGNEGVDNIGPKAFVEMFGLQEHPKWKEVYERVKNR